MVTKIKLNRRKNAFFYFKYAFKDGWTALLNASKNGNAALVKLLLAHKAPIEDRDCGGFTPLMWACYKNNLETVKVLLNHGANPNVQCKVKQLNIIILFEFI